MLEYTMLRGGGTALRGHNVTGGYTMLRGGDTTLRGHKFGKYTYFQYLGMLMYTKRKLFRTWPNKIYEVGKNETRC